MEVMRLYTASQVRTAEKRSFGPSFGIGADISMAYAGKALADEVMKRFSHDKKIAVVCGHGNNGGDGFCAAMLLYGKGYSCDLFFDVEKYDLLTVESRRFFDICSNVKLVKPFPAALLGYDCVIDAVLGIGITGKPRHETAEYIRLINSARSFIIAADIPSGLPASGPVDHDLIVRADLSVAMGFVKLNMAVYPGKIYAGEIIVGDAGFPDKITGEAEYESALIDEHLIKKFNLRKYADDTHKYKKGHVLVIGGETGMEGAVLLCAKSAFASGAGLVTIASPESSRSIIAGKIPEVMTLGIPEKETSSVVKVLSAFVKERKVSSIVCGPGLSKSAYAKKIFEAAAAVALENGIPAVFDGGALHHLALLKGIDLGTAVLTPHLGEGSVLLETESSIIVQDISGAAQSIAKRYNAVCLLKGASSAVSFGDEHMILSGGSSALACAGSGDVLAGILGAFLLRKNLRPVQSAALAAWIHYRSGILADEESGGIGQISASDIISMIKKSLSEIV
jgi:ADP-dependent NAD(P)H-hydrate dehydratase / NAD(P)H-hydrate epimerase